MVIHRHTYRDPVAIPLIEGEQALANFGAHHRPHRIRQDEQRVTACQHLFHDRQNVRAHEGLTAGNADLFCALTQGVDLIKKWHHVAKRQIDEVIIGRRAFYVAVAALNIAERARVKPQRFEAAPVHRPTGLPLRRDERVAKLLFDQCRMRHGPGH